MRVMKTCSNCKQEKSFEFFHKHSSNNDGYQYQCIVCRKEGCSRSFKKISPEARQERLIRTAEWRKENKEFIKKYSKDYSIKNRAKRTSAERKRQAAKLQRTPTWLTDFDKLHMDCLYQVAAMRTKESGQVWHVDHVIPLQGKTVSGFHVPANLRVIPATENMRKHNKYGDC